MDEIKKINADQLNEIAGERGFSADLLLKDYYITAILYLLKDVDAAFFKGGTALQKIFLDYSRLSEDADYTITQDNGLMKETITKRLEGSGLFDKVTYDKDVAGFTRIVAHYQNFSGKGDTVFVDINQRAKLLAKPERHEIKHFYSGFIPEFSVNTLAKEEMIAEKVAATVGRNRPRDHYDVYALIKAGILINLDLVRAKCRQSGDEFSIPRMFSKAGKLKARWDRDMIPLLAEEVPFVEVMRTLAGYFKLKEAKEAGKDKKPKKSILGLKPTDWGKGSERTSEEVDKIAYGAKKPQA